MPEFDDYNFTQKSKEIFDSFSDHFEQLYSKSDLQRKFDRLNPFSSSYLSNKAELIRNLRGALDRDIEMDIEDSEIQKLIEELPDASEMESVLFEKMHLLYENSPKPGDYIQRLVYRLGDPDFRDDTTRVAIVKQFLRHTKYKTSAVIKKVIEKMIQANPDLDPKSIGLETVIKETDEGLFEGIESFTKAQRRSLELLVIANDLSNGYFRTNGKTRTNLYLFAMAFGLKAPNSNGLVDSKLDLEKNLFYDYYNDNLLRYITKEYKENPANFEAEPTGEGINYKNYSEFINLYYINRDDLTPKEKIQKSQRLITKATKSLKDRDFSEEDSQEMDSEAVYESEVRGQHTGFFKDTFWNSFNGLKESELYGFIMSNFVLKDGDRNSSPITLASNTVTAAEAYNSILEDLKRASLEETLQAHLNEKDIQNYADTGFEDDQDFIDLLKKMEDFMHFKRHENDLLEFRSEEDKVTRTDIIALFTFLYTENHIDETPTFKEIYEDFKDELNPILKRARFQELNPKNLYDMYVVIMTFRWLSLI